MQGLDSMAELRYTDESGLGAIHHAVAHGHIGMVRKMLVLDADLLSMPVEDSARNTALHLVVLSKNLPLFKAVQEFSPNCSLQNAEGNTPLHLAVQVGDLKMSRQLLSICGEEAQKLANNKGQRAVELCSDSRLKLELQGVTINPVNESQSARRFTHQRANTPEYTQALRSVLKGDQLN